MDSLFVLLKLFGGDDDNAKCVTLNIMISIIVMVTVAYFRAARIPLVNRSTNSSYNLDPLPPKTALYSAVILNAARSIENCAQQKQDTTAEV